MKFDHKKLTKARKERGLSIYACARELSKAGMVISHQTLINWEKGLFTPNCHQLADMAMFYGKELLYFFKHKTHHSSVLLN